MTPPPVIPHVPQKRPEKREIPQASDGLKERLEESVGEGFRFDMG
jgi:hypothetical protein